MKRSNQIERGTVVFTAALILVPVLLVAAACGSSTHNQPETPVLGSTPADVVKNADSGIGGGGGGGGIPPPLGGNPEIRPGPPQGDYWLRDSVDPFTTEYEWEDGTILVGNLSQEDLQGFIDQGVTYFDNQVLAVEVWVDPETGQPREVVAGELRAYFDETAGEEQLRDMFDENGFEVVFSWFEPGAVHETNEHASFQLAFDREVYDTVDDALEFLNSLEYTLEAYPNYFHDHRYGTAPPVDDLSMPCLFGPPPW